MQYMDIKTRRPDTKIFFYTEKLHVGTSGLISDLGYASVLVNYLGFSIRILLILMLLTESYKPL